MSSLNSASPDIFSPDKLVDDLVTKDELLETVIDGPEAEVVKVLVAATGIGIHCE